MPGRTGPPAADGSLQIYRTFDFGRLARLVVVDDRQYRSPLVQGEGAGNLPRPLGGGPLLEGTFDESRTMFGRTQEQWIESQLSTSRAAWNVLAQQTMMAQCDRAPGDPSKGFSMDAWDGYVAPRNRLLGFVRDAPVDNFVVLSGDIHTAAVADLVADFQTDGAPVVGTELVAPSASSLEFLPPTYVEGARANPHIKMYDTEHRGYLRMIVDRRELRAEYVYPSTTVEPAATAVAGPVWRVGAGTAGAHEV
jgi:alkaline phosphatase D